MKLKILVFIVILYSCKETNTKHKEMSVNIQTYEYGHFEDKIYDSLVQKFIDTLSLGIVPKSFKNECFEIDFCKSTNGIWELKDMKNRIISSKLCSKKALEEIIANKKDYDIECSFDKHLFARPIDNDFNEESIWEIAMRKLKK